MSGYPAMKVVFPAPPPTTNELTGPQRAQLVRKTKKIEQLLGTTPQLLDISGAHSGGPIQITFSAEPDSPSSNGKRRFASVRNAASRRGSIDSDSATSASSSYSSGSPLRRSASVASTVSTRLSPVSASSSPSRPASALSMNPSGSRCSSPAISSPSRTSTVSAEIAPKRPDSLVLDDAQFNFVIPTASSVRKQKMDRLRKKLGAGVPLELVFPDAKDEDGETDCPATTSTSTSPSGPMDFEKPCPPLPPAVPRSSMKKSSKRIARARDSIADASSIHRAAKKVQGTIVVIPELRKKKSRASLVISGPIPGPNTTTRSSLTFQTISLAEARRQQRLSRIVESPDEEFSVNVVNVLRLSRHDLSVLAAAATNGDKDMRTAEWVADISVNTGEVKRKRPTSYRKPVPSFLVDSDTSSSEELSF